MATFSPQGPPRWHTLLVWWLWNWQWEMTPLCFQLVPRLKLLVITNTQIDQTQHDKHSFNKQVIRIKKEEGATEQHLVTVYFREQNGRKRLWIKLMRRILSNYCQIIDLLTITFGVSQLCRVESETAWYWRRDFIPN